jgi:hypothetical protein
MILYAKEVFLVSKKETDNRGEVIRNKQEDYFYMYGENVRENNAKQEGRKDEQKDKQIKSEQEEKNRKLRIEEEEKNKKSINNRISEEASDRVYVEEPKRRLKEQEEQEQTAAAKKFAEQKIDASKSEISKETVVFDALNSINGNINLACKYLDGEDLARARKFESHMKIFTEAVSSGKIVMNEEQTNTFVTFGRHGRVVDKASAVDYVDFAFTKVLPFIAGVAIVTGVALGAVSPLSGLSKIDNLLNTAPTVGGINKLGNLGDNLLR